MQLEKRKKITTDLKGDINVTTFSMTSKWHSRGARAEVEAVIGARTRLVNTNYTRFPQRSLRHPTAIEEELNAYIVIESGRNQFFRVGSNNQAKHQGAIDKNVDSRNGADADTKYTQEHTDTRTDTLYFFICLKRYSLTTHLLFLYLYKGFFVEKNKKKRRHR